MKTRIFVKLGFSPEKIDNVFLARICWTSVMFCTNGYTNLVNFYLVFSL